MQERKPIEAINLEAWRTTSGPELEPSCSLSEDDGAKSMLDVSLNPPTATGAQILNATLRLHEEISQQYDTTAKATVWLTDQPDDIIKYKFEDARLAMKADQIWETGRQQTSLRTGN